jgi:hypothetical protein
MKSMKRSTLTAICCVLAIAVCSTVALATEPGEGIQYPPGAGVGGIPGLAPPPGFSTYFGATYNTTSATNGVGTKGAPQVTNFATFAGLLWTPGWKLLGADYYAGIGAAVLDVTLDFGGGVANRTQGLTSPSIKPIGLSWKLPNDFWLETGLTVYIPVGQYDKQAAVVAGDNYWTVEPDLAVTWLSNGWNLSGKVLYDFNTENTATHYHSGDLFTAEFTAGKQVGKWNFGGGAYYWAQTQRDTNHGVPTNSLDFAVVGKNGVNPNGVDFGVGPFAAYNFEGISIQFKYLWDVYTRNTTTAGIGQGSHATVSFFVPL